MKTESRKSQMEAHSAQVVPGRGSCDSRRCSPAERLEAVNDEVSISGPNGQIALRLSAGTVDSRMK
jgi:hypothetical protein